MPTSPHVCFVVSIIIFVFVTMGLCIFASFESTGTRIPDPPPFFFLIWSLLRLWYGFLSGSISLSHLSIFYNISCYNSLVLLTFVSRYSCRFTYKYMHTMAIECFKILNKLSPSCLHDLVVFKHCKYNLDILIL